LKIINKSGLVVDLKLFQLGGRGESDLDVLGIGVAGEMHHEFGPSVKIHPRLKFLLS